MVIPDPFIKVSQPSHLEALYSYALVGYPSTCVGRSQGLGGEEFMGRPSVCFLSKYPYSRCFEGTLS
jgi:hypothetical protein